jgi:hypothetical protein
MLFVSFPSPVRVVLNDTIVGLERGFSGSWTMLAVLHVRETQN